MYPPCFRPFGHSYHPLYQPDTGPDTRGSCRWLTIGIPPGAAGRPHQYPTVDTIVGTTWSPPNVRVTTRL